MRHHPLVIAVALLAVAFSGPAMVQGAPIAWSLGRSFSGTSGFQAIDTTGTLVEAVNLSDAGPLAVDPGGLNITFQPADKLNAGFFNSGSPGTTDANWNAIIDRTDYSSDNGTVSNFLSGLTTGNYYQIQLFASDSRACCSGRTQTFDDGQGNSSPTFVQGTFTSILGTFMADASSQAIGLTASSTDPVLSAYVLRELAGPPPPPPPGAVIMPAFANGTPASYGSPTLLINGAGLLGTGPDIARAHQTIHTQGWLIDNVDPANELVFTMPGEADLNGMYVWQYSQGTCCTGRGVSTFDLQFSTDGGVTYPTSISMGPLAAASGTSDEFAQWVSFAEQTGVTHVKIASMQDFPALSNPGWQGLNEVRFQGSVTMAPQAGRVGNTISTRAQATDGSTQVLWSNFYGAPVAGTLDSVNIAFQGQDSANTFELFQLRPTGTANQYEVIASSGVITPSAASNSEVSLPLPNGPFELEKGDLLFHYGRGIPYADNLSTPEAHNNQLIFYPSPSGPTVGTPVTLGAGGFPLSGYNRDYAWAVELGGFVETAGNGAGQGLTGPDTASSILVVMDNDPFSQPGQLDTWQFFNDTANTGGRLITPVLLRDTAGTVEVMGIGATRTGTENGFQQYDFELVEGTDVVEPGDLFGFYYGDGSGGNQGSVEYTEITGAMTIRLFTENLGDGLQMTDVFQNPTYQLPRFYSINATTLSAAAIPEPSTLVLAALGLVGLGFYGRRRRRA